jgi:hypothetical protein
LPGRQAPWDASRGHLEPLPPQQSQPPPAQQPDHYQPPQRQQRQRQLETRQPQERQRDPARSTQQWRPESPQRESTSTAPRRQPPPDPRMTELLLEMLGASAGGQGPKQGLPARGSFVAV